MNKFFRLSVPLLFVALAFCLVMPLVASAEMVKKVDNFIVFMDQSGSMAWAKAEPGNQKFEQAVDAVKRFDKVTPELGYNGGVSTFAPYGVVSSPEVYKNGSLQMAADTITPPFNYFTPLGDGLIDVDPDIGRLSGKTALILYTDGESNEGTDPVQEAKGLYDKYGNNLCIHVVSYADSPHGKNVINDIAALSGCSVVADADSLSTDDAMADFAKAVLYEEKAPAPKKAAPAPAPAPVKVAKEVITFNLLFDFDKAQIKDEMIPTLEQAQMILEEDPETDFVLSGHTDSIGTEEYNQGLSERRAAAVKKWLVDNGVSGSRLKTVGYGETRAKYDNSTSEGRKLNRRVEMQSQ